MQILFAAAVLSMCALLGASWAIARHIRKAAGAGENPGNLMAEKFFTHRPRVSNIAHKTGGTPARNPSHGKRWSSDNPGDLSDPYQRPRSIPRRAAQ